MGSRAEAVLAWIGGGERRELSERHERSIHVVAGVVVLLAVALAWLVSTLAVAASSHSPMSLIVASTLVFGVLVGTVSRAVCSGPLRGWPAIAGRATVAVVVGVVVGELAALVLFSGSIDRRLDEHAALRADTAPAVLQASAEVGQTRQTRTALDDAVEQARRRRDEALVVARCEFNPSPACPQTHITGVPGAGPENRTANQFLADTQRELENAIAERVRAAPDLDARIIAEEQSLAKAREAASADIDRGIGARWAAMNDITVANPGAMLLRLLAIGFFTLLILLPLILKLWRGETTHDRSAGARAERERAELEAETAIALKRSEVRAAVETLWADQQLASARLAAEAQTEIDREQQRRRVIEAREALVHAESQRIDDIFLPIAAEAEAASLAAAQLPAGTDTADADIAEAEDTENLPAVAEPSGAVEPRREGGTPLIPSIPDVTKAAVRWIRPFVPPIVANAIETTTRPLRGARQVYEETEEIHFTFKRTHRVSVQSEESAEPEGQPAQRPSTAAESTTTAVGYREPLESQRPRRELPRRDGPRVHGGPRRPRQLPSAE